jgi:hypothetical protein
VPRAQWPVSSRPFHASDAARFVNQISREAPLEHICRQITASLVAERLPLLSMLVLWTRYGAGKLGIMKFLPISENKNVPEQVDYAEWESKAIATYLDRHNL